MPCGQKLEIKTDLASADHSSHQNRSASKSRRVGLPATLEVIRSRWTGNQASGHALRGTHVLRPE